MIKYRIYLQLILNEYKIRKMYSNKAIHNCDISEFKVTLLSTEYID